MNIVKCVSWRDCEPQWTQWKDFKKDDPTPQKLNTAKLYLEMETIVGKTPRRTLGYIKEVPGDPTTTGNILGCAIVYAKELPGLSIGGIGKMAVDPKYRLNGIATQLLDVCIRYMFQAGFHISILWASVLKVYEKAGYIPLTEKHQETNMMYRPIHGLPVGWTKEKLLDLKNNPKIGTF